MPYVETSDGVQLFYNDWGPRSGTPVVFIHGWPLNADMWEYQTVPLAEAGLRCIAYDRRGFGRSSQPWTGYDYDTFAADLKAVLEHLDLRGAVLVGFSMGGGEVARYLGRYGADRIAKVALVASVVPFILKTPDNPSGADASVFDSIKDGLRKDRPNFLANFGKAFFGAGMLNFSLSSEILDWAQRLALMAGPKGTIECVTAFGTTDFRPDMKAFTVPTLIIHGVNDQTVPIDPSARQAAAMVPGATLIEYEGAPHGLFFTDKDRLNADLLAFIRG